jgi:hypothetical protein
MTNEEKRRIYQHIANRLNEGLGVGGWRPHQTVNVKEVVRSNGQEVPRQLAALELELTLRHQVASRSVTVAAA